MKKSSTILEPLFVLAVAGLLAGCGESASTDDDDDNTGPPPPPPDIVDISVDSNRDGWIDANDDEHEYEWNADFGAVFLANIDDDDLNGVRDAQDEYISVVADNELDLLDLARIRVAAWPEVPDGAIGRVKLLDNPDIVEDDAVFYIRIHKHMPDNSWMPVMGSVGPCGHNGDGACEWLFEHVLTSAEIAAGVELGIEAMRLVGVDATPDDTQFKDPCPWDGYVGLSFEVEAEGQLVTTDAVPDGVDRVVMKVAPWILFGNLHVADVVFASTISSKFVNAIKPVVEEAGMYFWGIPYNSSPEGIGDHWTEDIFETGYTAMPAPDGTVHGMRIAIPRPFYSGNPMKWLERNHMGIDVAAQQVYNKADVGSTYDSYGNHDLVPPYENANGSYPLGRIIYGHPPGVLNETEHFYASQLVQTPAINPDTSWLAVGHIDEVFSYMPATTELGWKLIIAAPAECTAVMTQWQNDGHGNVEMFVGKDDWQGHDAAVSINELLANATMAQWNQYSQGKIDLMVDMMVAEIGLQQSDMILLPIYYENVGGSQYLAYHPGTGNALVFGDHVLPPDPFGPVINGEDAFKTDYLARIASPASQLGSTGQGMIVNFVDDWSTYHNNMGEVHCGTNQEGPPATDPWWEVVR